MIYNLKIKAASFSGLRGDFEQGRLEEKGVGQPGLFNRDRERPPVFRPGRSRGRAATEAFVRRRPTEDRDDPDQELEPFCEVYTFRGHGSISCEQNSLGLTAIIFSLAFCDWSVNVVFFAF